MIEERAIGTPFFRCIDKTVDRSIKPFGPDIEERVNVLLHFGNHRFDTYFRLEEVPNEYVCRVKTRPLIYERMAVAREHLHPYFVREARAILHALAECTQYLPSRIDAAEGLPLAGGVAARVAVTPSDISTRVRVPTKTSRPWRATANAFLYAVSLLNDATEGPVVDYFQKSPYCPASVWRNELPTLSSRT
jgi:hypothetical protein